MDPEEWAGRGDWVGSAIRDIVMDVLQARDQAASVRLAETTPETDPAATPDIGQAARSDGGPGAHLPETR